MKKSIYFGAMAFMLAFAVIYVSVANAQNVTTNPSYAGGNVTVNANKTSSAFGTNATKGAGNIINKTEMTK
jgi:hypothetical protein